MFRSNAHSDAFKKTSQDLHGRAEFVKLKHNLHHNETSERHIPESFIEDRQRLLTEYRDLQS